MSTAGLLTAPFGEEGSSVIKTVGGRSDLDRDLIKLRKPLFRESRFFFSSPPSLSSWNSEPLVDDRLRFNSRHKACWFDINLCASRTQSNINGDYYHIDSNHSEELLKS
jgi:hypothetical protein